MASDDTHKIALRYAKALFALAEGASALAAVEKDLQAQSRLLTQLPELARVLISPLVARAAKAAVADAVLAKLHAHEFTRGFVRRLALSGRLSALPAISNEFETMMIAHRGEIVLEVITAAPLSSTASLSAALAKAYGRKVRLQSSVDSSLIGGLVVKAGGTRMDYSLKNRLTRLSRALKTQAA